MEIGFFYDKRRERKIFPVDGRDAPIRKKN
jgi:hypothetical protein